MRTISGLLIIVTLLLSTLGSGFAQEATPPASNSESASSPLADLGYADLLVSTDGMNLDAPVELAAGRYRLVVENTDPLRVAEVFVIALPVGISIDAARAVLMEANTPEIETLPDDFFSMTFVGGAYAFPGSTSDAIVTLEAGAYAVANMAYSVTDEGVEPSTAVSELTVTGEMPDVAEPKADVTVELSEMQIDMPATIPAGPQIWRVTNNGGFIHFVDVNSYPNQVTREQVQATLDTVFGMPGTPPENSVELLDPEALQSVLVAVLLSPGQTAWHAIDLEPGTYVAFCWVPGPADVPIHASMGMFAIVTVE
jgi:hypothetical protein